MQIEFNHQGRGVAYIETVGDNVRVVHNDKPGKLYKVIDDYTLALSPDGRRVAYGVIINEKWRMVIDGREGAIYDSVGPAVFSPDSRHIAFEAKIGERWHIVVDDKMSPGCIAYFDKPAFSGDSAKVLYIENPDGARKMRVVVADLEFRKLSFKDSSGIQLVINSGRTRVASVTESNSKKKVIEFSFSQPDVVKEGPLYDDTGYIAFGMDGVSVSYFADKSGARFIIFNGKEERLPDGDVTALPVVRPDNKGVGVIMDSKEGAFLHQAFFYDGGKEKHYEEAADLVYSKDGSLHAYTARKGNNWFVVVKGKEGPAFDRVITPVFSPDGKFLVYRARKDGKRFVVVADTNGRVISQHPGYERVFQPVFTTDGKSIAYGVKDGNKLIWKVEKL